MSATGISYVLKCKSLSQVETKWKFNIKQENELRNQRIVDRTESERVTGSLRYGHMHPTDLLLEDYSS